MGDAVGPVRGQERHEMFDVLRGVAMLGIFAVNLWSFAMPKATYLNPSAYGSLEGANGLAWLVVHVFFDSKFITLFSLLFGAGLVVMTQRADAQRRSPWARHLRRSAALLILGMAHAYLLWWGDILVSYAVCGFLVFMLRRLKPGKQLVIGLLLFCVPPLLYLASYSGWASQLEGEELQSEVAEWAPSPAALDQEIATLQGKWTEQMTLRVPEAAMMQTFVMLIFFVWRVSGVMLIGMALYQWGLLSGTWDASRYRRLFRLGLPAGLALVGCGAWLNASAGFPWAESMFLYSNFNYFGSVVMALGYVGLIGLWIASGANARLRGRFAAVGRLALTCYLGQTLIATTLFFGHGLGLFGEISRVGQFGLFLAVSGLQLWFASWWLGRFRQGPLEWLLRGVVYGKFSPLRLKSPA